MEHYFRTAAATGTDGLIASRTVKLLVSLWNAGTMTPQTVQRITKAVQKDLVSMNAWNLAKMVSEGKLVTTNMDKFQDIEAMSKLGAEGDQISNCLRDLERQLPQTKLEFPEPIRIPLRMKVGDPPVVVDTPQWLLLPHVLFAHLYHKHRKVWEARFMASHDKLNSFWDSQAGNPQFENGGLKGRAHDMLDRCIPLRVHSGSVGIVGKVRSFCKKAERILVGVCVWLGAD